MSGRDQFYYLLVWFDGIDMHSEAYDDQDDAKAAGEKLPASWDWKIITPKDLEK